MEPINWDINECIPDISKHPLGYLCIKPSVRYMSRMMTDEPIYTVDNQEKTDSYTFALSQDSPENALLHETRLLMCTSLVNIV